MQNAWNVIFFKDGRKLLKVFEGDKPRESGAIDFGKRLKKKGIVEVYITSRRRAFAPPPNKRTPPKPGLLWCPYCLAWREFIETSIRMKDGLHTPVCWRCPICTISTNDHYVRKYNEMMVARLDHRSRTQVPSEKQIRQAVNRR